MRNYERLYHKLPFDGVRVRMDMASSDNLIQLKEDNSLPGIYAGLLPYLHPNLLSVPTTRHQCQSINLTLLSSPPQHHRQTPHSSLLLLYALPLPSSSIHLCNVTHPICHDVQRFLASLPQASDLTSLLGFLTTYLFSY
jgi:hypothetical protein